MSCQNKVNTMFNMILEMNVILGLHRLMIAIHIIFQHYQRINNIISRYYTKELGERKCGYNRR